MSSIVIQGDTSGSITVEAPSVAGTHTLTLPKATGNIATDATVGLGTKNLIINGNFNIWQRNTSVTGVSNAEFVADRWAHVISGGTWDAIRSTDVPSGQGFGYSVKIDCTATTTSHIWLEQKIEGQNIQHIKKGSSNAESLTVSFWVKSNKTGTYIVWFRDMDNARHCSQSYTISSANTWEKKTVTFPPDTSGTFDNDNNASLRLHFFLTGGTTYTTGTLATTWETTTNGNAAVGQTDLGDSTSNEFLITGVQLEVGENATPFEHRMYSQELAMCQRYYLRNTNTGAYAGIGLGRAYSTAAGNTPYWLPVTMRASPTVGYSALTDFELTPTVGASGSGNPTALRNDGAAGTNLDIGWERSSLTSSGVYLLEHNASTDNWIDFNAEL